MQTNKIHILSTRPVDKALIEEGAKRDIIIDEISFISTEPIINNAIKENIENFSGKISTLFLQV